MHTKYCVGDLNHLSTSVNLCDPKDPTIKNGNFIHSKTEDLHCKIEENDVLVSKNTHSVIENLTACESTDKVANLKNEFLPECVSDETVGGKIEIIENTLCTIQELKHICREYSENVADEGTETSQISKIHKLDKTNNKKVRKDTKDQKGEVQHHNKNLTACENTDGVINLKNEFIPEEFVPDETVGAKIEIIENTLCTIQELKHICREYSENVADEGTETSQISRIHELDKTDGKKVRKKTKDQKREVQYHNKNLPACENTDRVVNLKNEFIPEECLPDEIVGGKIEIIENTLGTIQELKHICREYSENVADEGTETSQISKIHKLDKTNGKTARKKTKDQKGEVQYHNKNLTDCENTDGVANLKNEFNSEECVPDETVGAKIEIIENTLCTIEELKHICREYSENVADEGTETSQISKIHELDKTNGQKVRKKSKDQKGKVQTKTFDTFLHKARGRVKKRKRKVSDGLFVRLERMDISDKLLANTENSTSSTTSSARTSNENNLRIGSQISKICELDKTAGKKVRKKSGNQKGKVQTNTLDTFLHKARGGVKHGKRNVSDKLFVRLERIDISNRLLDNLEDSTSSTTSSARTNNENNLGTDQETSKGLKLNKLPKQVGNSHSIHSGRPKKMSRDIKTNKNKGTSSRNRNRIPKTGVEDMEQQELDMEEEVIREEYKCHDCNKVLINQKSLKHHIKQCHEEVNTPSFQCYHCNKIVKHRQSLIFHLRQWHTEGDKLFHCDLCTYKTNLQKALAHHVYRAHVPNDQKPSFKCKLCPYETKWKGYLQLHINRVHLRKIKTKKCDQCDWVGNSISFSHHVRTKHLREEFICDKCNYKAKTKGRLVAHQLIHSKAKQFSCPKCTYQTNYKCSLKAHLKYHEDNFQSCPECSQLVQEGNFYEHVRYHQRKKLKVKKKCPECGKEVFELSEHLLTHTGDRIQCPECSYSAVTRRSLKQHIQKYHDHHKEQKRFICYHCNKEITSRGGFIKHLRDFHTHDPCECYNCGKKLKSKRHLSGHLRIVHDNVKWLECDLCPEEKRFRTKHARNLKWHRVLHLNKDEVIMYKSPKTRP